MRSKPSVAKFADISTRAVDQLGLALARHRAREGLSQTAVAVSAGLRQATVSKVEQGVATTQIQTIYAVCAALGLELVVRPRATATAPLQLKDFT